MTSKDEKLAYLRSTPGGASMKRDGGGAASGLAAGAHAIGSEPAKSTGDIPGNETTSSFLPTGTLSAAPAERKSAGQGLPDTKLLDELDRLEKELAKLKKQFAPGGISKDEKMKLDAIQARIDSIFKKLKATGEVIAVTGDPRPKRPSDADGEIEYQGIPLDKIKDPRQKEIARRNAQTIRQGVKSLDTWAKQLDEKSNEHTEKQTKYEAAVGNSEDVNAALTKDLKGGKIKKLSDAEGAPFAQTLANYEQAGMDVEIGVSALRAQAYRIAAAKAMVEQAEMLVEAYYKEKDRDKEGKKLAELKEKLKDLKDGVNSVIAALPSPKDLATKGPVAIIGAIVKKAGLDFLKESLVDEIVDGLLGGEKLKTEMNQIQTRITALNQRLEALKIGGLNAGVNLALNNLKAEGEETVTKQLALQKAKQAQGQAVDLLADMEKRHPNTTTVFGQLKNYYAAVQQAGADAMKESKEYDKTLTGAQGAMTHTAELRQAVRSDRAAMNQLYPAGGAEIEDLEQQAQGEAIIKYSEQMDKWYASKDVDKKLLEEQQRRENLRNNKQFAYVGQLVNAVQEQGLGHMQRDKKIPK